MSRSESWLEFKQYMLEKYPICEQCSSNRSIDVHHWVIHYDKRFWRALDVEENCGCVCRRCHESGIVNSRSSRVEHWNRRVDQGFDMDRWYTSVPLRFKERFP